jgi:hypothetical protein
LIDFDVAALFALVNDQRAARGMSMGQLAKEIAWMSPRTLAAMSERNHSAFVGCHHVLPIIQWVGRTPESFMTGAARHDGELLPDPGPAGWRWYWNMPELASELDSRRIERELTWSQAAAEFGSTPAEIKALQKTKYGMSIGFCMRAAGWLDRTATSFLWEHDGRGLPWSGRRVSSEMAEGDR